MFADDELLVGSNFYAALGSDGVEASSAGVSVVDAHNGQVVVHAFADALVGAHGAGVNLGGALFAAGTEHGLFLGGFFHDVLQLFLLGLEVFLTDGEAVLQLFGLGLLGANLEAGVVDGFLVNLTEKFLVLDFLVQGIVLAGVGDGFQLALVFLDDALVLGDGELGIGDVAIELIYHGGQSGAALLEGGDFFFQGRYLCRQFAT